MGTPGPRASPRVPFSTLSAHSESQTGGVGQSLFSHTIANMLKHNHAFLDMNIYFSDDEFRKQCDGLVGKLVVTGQEAPDTSRTFREDLYKKHVSSDPVACRCNYAIVTRLIELSGLKRFEMNNPIAFGGVTEATFPSILRRSLVIELKARFENAVSLQKEFPAGDHAAHGVFLKDPTLKHVFEIRIGCVLWESSMST